MHLHHAPLSFYGSFAHPWLIAVASFLAFCGASRVDAATVLVEAESFADHGGWTLDTQFIREMGSP